MPKTVYDICIGKNEGLVISPSELLEQYFFGTLPRTTDGQEFPLESIASYIKQAQDQIEDKLSLVLICKEIEESFEFVRREFEEWGYIQTTYPVTEPVELNGYINDVRQIYYPAEWLVSKKTTEKKDFQRRLNLVPGSDGARTNSVVYSGITPHLGFYGYGKIPDYWRAKYFTGWKSGEVPDSIKSVISKLAAVPIFAILGDLIIGAGIANQSISIDGLSQSIGTTSSATNSGYGARILELQKQIKSEMVTLESRYVGLNFTVL